MSAIRSCVVLTVFFTVLLAVLPTGHGLKCWYCNSDTDPRCGDPFNLTLSYNKQEDCNNQPYPIPNYGKYVCRKVKYHRQNNEIAVARQCVFDGDREQHPCSVTQLANYLRVESCSVCDTELCNKAPALSVISAFLGPVLIVLSKMKIF